jgi:hypothetical protein
MAVAAFLLVATRVTQVARAAGLRLQCGSHTWTHVLVKDPQPAEVLTTSGPGREPVARVTATGDRVSPLRLPSSRIFRATGRSAIP